MTTNTGKPKKARKARMSPNIGYLLLVVGIIVCSSAFDYQNKIMALIGTSIIFWGALLIYFKPYEYESTQVLDSTLQQYYAFINEMIPNVGNSGKPEYFSPPDISGLTTTSLKISGASKEKSIFPENKYTLTDAVKIMPPGQKLSEAMEESSKAKYTSINPVSLGPILEKAVIEDLGLSKSINIEYSSSLILVRVRRSIYSKLYRSNDLRGLLDNVGDPLISAIACAYSRSTGRPIILEGINLNEHNEIIDYRLKLLSTTEDAN